MQMPIQSNPALTSDEAYRPAKREMVESDTYRNTEHEQGRAEINETGTAAPPRYQSRDGAPAHLLPILARAFLEKLIRLQLLSPEVVESFLKDNSTRLQSYTSAEAIGKALIADGLLTEYQLDRVFAGTFHGLILGNHRVLDRLGAGGMGIVFRAEHMYMKRQVAIKVLPVDDDCPPALLSRFYAEMQVLAGLHHPNIVAAFDSGLVPSPDPGEPALLYLAMELVEGGDLEKHVHNHGPLEVCTACEWIAQAACGLQEAHDHNLIHRDLKPSNLLISRHLQAKIVDFGLVQQFNIRQTTLGTLLGTIEFMPPEQSVDSSSVGAAADIYGLGATLFWVLTGEPPRPSVRSISQALKNLQETPPRLLRTLRPDAPPELDAFLQTMLDRDPTRRPTLPLTVSRTLAAFCQRQDGSNRVVPSNAARLR